MSEAAEDLSLRGRKILLVDDNDDTLSLLAAMLRRFGAEPTRARTGRSALSLLEIDPPDLLLVDLWMPGMDGFELLFAARERIPALPAIALTAFPSSWHREQALAAGFDAFLTKPIEPHTLVEAVAGLLDRKVLPGGSSGRGAGRLSASPHGESAAWARR